MAGAGFGTARQLGHADAQALTQADNVVPARVAPATLDVADPGLLQAGGFGQLGLTDALVGPDGPDGCAQGGQVGGMTRHSVGFVLGPDNSSPSAPHDLRDALVAHAHDLRNGGHRQAGVVGGPDSLVTGLTQFLGGPLQLGFALGVVLGKGRQATSGLGGLAFGTGDLGIV